MPIRSIKSIRRLENKRVLVRVDFNVPIKDGVVADDSRLIASLPTIRFLKEKKAKIVLVSHLGRPEGKRNASYSLAPVAKQLGKLLQESVQFVPDLAGTSVHRAIEVLPPGGIIMLENMRFSPHEQKQTALLAAQLAALADIFVLDGFAVAHRPDASVAGVARYIPGYAGFLLKQEIDTLLQLTKKPKRPFVAIVGGAKVETKAPLIKTLLRQVDTLLLGGGIVNTYLKGAGYGVGASLVDADYLTEAVMFGRKENVILPIDVIVGRKNGHVSRHVYLQPKPHRVCEPYEAIFDIGPATIRLYSTYIKKAKTLLWNGALGYFEEKPFDVGTRSIARLVASRSKGKAFGVIGGGETIQAMEQVRMIDAIDFVSTGGGAMLELLAGKKLPGIEALRR